VEVDRAPQGLTAEVVVNSIGAAAIQVHVEEEQSRPRTAGNLVLHAWREVTPLTTEKNPSPRPRVTDYGHLPAISFEILPGR
jgi:hypothetical protein